LSVFQFLIGKILTQWQRKIWGVNYGFQFLIGKILTSSPVFQCPWPFEFQFLIGKILTLTWNILDGADTNVFQFLIGKILTINSSPLYSIAICVSIPHR